MIKKILTEKIIINLFILLIFFFSAWLNFSWNNLDYLQWKSLDEYTFHGVLLKLHSALLSLDLRSFFSFSFYSYGLIFFLVNYLAVMPFISDPSSELVVFIPKMVTAVFFISSLFFMNLSLKKLKVSKLHRFSAFIYIICMPGIWFNVSWFHPDFMMLFFLLISIYFLTTNNFTIKNYNDPAVIFWGVAIATKIQAITFAPLFFWLSFKTLSYKTFFVKELKIFFKICLFTAFIYILLNPYLLHIDGLNAWIANLQAESFNASGGADNQILDMSTKLNFGLFNYFISPILFFAVIISSIYLIFLDLYSRKLSLMGGISLTFLINILYLVFFMSKGWNHYYLPYIFLSAIIIFFLLNKFISHIYIKVIFLLLLLSSQGYFFMSDLEKIIFNRLNHIVQSKDSIYNYQPLEYSIDELQQKNSSIFDLLSSKIDSNSHVLSSAYLGIPIKKLNLKFNQIRIIYGDIAKSDILWLIKAQGSKNYILIKKDSSKKTLVNLSLMLSFHNLKMEIIDENNHCYLIKIKNN